MRFPRTDAQLETLAMLAAEGLRKAAEELSSPPISANELDTRVKRMKERDLGTTFTRPWRRRIGCPAGRGGCSSSFAWWQSTGPGREARARWWRRCCSRPLPALGQSLQVLLGAPAGRAVRTQLDRLG